MYPVGCKETKERGKKNLLNHQKFHNFKVRTKLFLMMKIAAIHCKTVK